MSDRDPDQDEKLEPRAREVMRGEVKSDQLDPATVAQLAAWFGAPAAAFDEVIATRADEPDDPELAARRRVQRDAMAAADPALLARFDAMLGAGDRFIHLPEPLTLPIERPMSKVDVRHFRALEVATRDWERPDEVVDALEENVPQSVLRDLNRPVLSWTPVFIERDLGVDVGGMRATGVIREVMGLRLRMSEALMASVLAYRDMTELRARLDEPWDEIEIPEERITLTSEARPLEDLMWFGSVGYDPDM